VTDTEPNVEPVTGTDPVGHVFGNPDAPTCIVEFGDYECPYCAGAAPILRELVETSAGGIRLNYRNFPLFEVHPHALTAALAAESVAASGGAEAFWVMHRTLFKSQTRLADADLRRYALESGGDPELAVGEPAQRFAAVVQSDYQAGLDAGVSATPTLFIDGVPYQGRVELGALRRATGQREPNGSPPDPDGRSRRRPWQRR
jgi:protein-disulfide isomerase